MLTNSVHQYKLHEQEPKSFLSLFSQPSMRSMRIAYIPHLIYGQPT
jgi:hypothetical protein